MSRHKLRYQIRSNGTGLFWIIDMESNLPIAESAFTRNEAMSACEELNNRTDFATA